jgi:peptide/nickel transport system substrate-binding protein
MGELASSAGVGRTGRRPLDRRPMDRRSMDRLRTSRRRPAALLAAALAATIATVVVAGLVCGLVQALAGTGSPAPSGKIVLRVGLVNEPDNLNPFIGTSTSSFLIFHLNYDMLTGYKASNVAPAPELAESWSHSPDGKIWTFKLRPGVKWQDGVPFTASDVAFTYEYIIRNNMASYTSYTVGIKQVVAIDPLTVRFVCSTSKANMLGMWVPIVPEHIWSKVSPKAAQNSFQNPPDIVGTGPFQTVEFKKGQDIRMLANKEYWRGAPRIDEVIFTPYQNPDTMVQELRSGTIDACWGIPEAQVAPLSRDHDFKTIVYPVKGIDELGFNCYTGASLGNPVVRDWRFRQALAWAIDRQQIVKIAYDGYAVPGSTLVVPGYYHDPDWHWQPPADQTIGYDPAKATQLLAAAGYRTVTGKLLDKQGKPITLRLFACGAPPQGDNIGKLLAGYLGAIGIHVRFTYMDEGAMNDYLYNTAGGKFVPNMDLYVYNWTGDVDPMFIFSIFLTNQINGWSDCAWSNATYDLLYNQQAAAIDPARRQAVLYQMQQLLYQQSPYVILAYPKGLEAVDTSRWTGWVQSPSGVGSAIYSTDNIDSYLYVHPVQTGGAATAKSNGPLITFLVTAAIAVVLIVVAVVLRRRRPKAVETEERS